jgi:exonuclease III
MLIATYNVNGFRNYVKRAKVFELLKLKQLDIIFLQETHICNKIESVKVEKEWGGTSFWSLGGTPESKGTAILFNPRLECDIKYKYFDHNGRLVIVDIKINKVEMRLISMYAPNNIKERKQFLSNIQQYLVCNKPVIWAGDFNCVENIFLDKEGGSDAYGDQGAAILTECKRDFNLIEAFRALYPDKKEYSWFSDGKDIKGRLDRFYLSKNLLEHIISVHHDKFNISDHALQKKCSDIKAPRCRPN